MSEEAKEKRSKSSFYLDKITGTAGRALAAKWVKGTNAPWLTSAHALLTGDPVGDWHLTIGNPLNPIAMIGNLIVEDAEYEFSNELGPDDFPIKMQPVHLANMNVQADKKFLYHIDYESIPDSQRIHDYCYFQRDN